ncbi:MAG: hypothetical protein JSV56_12910 [Methanomassiliicoccales archaeon]|nr:MAG: hypothetical protein JSV56_12910 [Methanomassiliicoccales archaeon]
MSKNREEKLRNELSTLEDAILYAENKGIKDLAEGKKLLERASKFFEQGTWSIAEKELSQADTIKESQWYREFLEKIKGIEGKLREPIRFVDDGLCGKYGHLMVKVRLSNVRWYYQCRICKKRGKSQSIK